MEIVDEANLTYKQPFVFFFFLSFETERPNQTGRLISGFPILRREGERRGRHVDEFDRDDLSSYQRSKEKAHRIAGKRIPAIFRRNSDGTEQTKLPKREQFLLHRLVLHELSVQFFSNSRLFSSVPRSYSQIPSVPKFYLNFSPKFRQSWTLCLLENRP